MPIRALLKEDQSFTPEEAKALVQAFENTRKALRLADRDDPATLAGRQGCPRCRKPRANETRSACNYWLARFGTPAGHNGPSPASRLRGPRSSQKRRWPSEPLLALSNEELSRARA
jgi:hypothetical protein